MITIDDIKYEKAQWKFTPTLEQNFKPSFHTTYSTDLNLVIKLRRLTIFLNEVLTVVKSEVATKKKIFFAELEIFSKREEFQLRVSGEFGFDISTSKWSKITL